MCSRFLVSVDIIELQATEAYSILGLIQVTYNNNQKSIVEKEYITDRTKPCNSIDEERI
jgi:hypothetical protein